MRVSLVLSLAFAAAAVACGGKIAEERVGVVRIAEGSSGVVLDEDVVEESLASAPLPNALPDAGARD